MAQQFFEDADGVWEVAALGTRRVPGSIGEGEVFAHLVHTTEGWQQANGFVPKQKNDWIVEAEIWTMP